MNEYPIGGSCPVCGEQYGCLPTCELANADRDKNGELTRLRAALAERERELAAATQLARQARKELADCAADARIDSQEEVSSQLAERDAWIAGAVPILQSCRNHSAKCWWCGKDKNACAPDCDLARLLASIPVF